MSWTTQSQAQAHRVEKYLERRNKAIELLGNECINCQSKDKLQFDHVIPADKKHELRLMFINNSWEKMLAELQKCQLLCKSCHLAKTRSDNPANPQHGTRNMYINYDCRCNACRKAHTAYAYPRVVAWRKKRAKALSI